MIVEYLIDGSPECPLVRIFGSSDSEFIEFHNIIQRFVEGDCATLTLNKDELFDFHDIDGINLKRRENFGAFFDNGILTWSMSQENWRVVSLLVEPLIELPAKAEAHQWLTGPNSNNPLPASGLSVLLSKSSFGLW